MRATASLENACLVTLLLALLAVVMPGAFGAEPKTVGLGFRPPVPDAVFTLQQAVNTAVKNFPSIRAAAERINAARADITLAKTAYLPRLDLIAQEMRTTGNVTAGTILNQEFDVIPTQTGKEQGGSRFSNNWANNVAAGFNWLLYDFGLRGANVAVAQAQTRLTSANLRLTELDVAYQAADNYLQTVSNLQTIRAAQATLERMQASAVTAHALVDSGLRPGVDAALADYEVSQGKIRLIQAERATELSRVDLAESIGLAGYYIGIESEPVVESPPQVFKLTATKVNYLAHPLLQARAAAVQTEAAKVKVQDRAWYPHLWLNSAIWGRGSGINQISRPVLDGVLPQTANWAAGLTVSFPVFDIFAIRARKRHAISDEAAERANLDLALQILEQKDARARVLLYEAKRIADETPIMVKAARENQTKALERYSVGLADMVTVAQSERILAQAEAENAVAQVQVWRAILAMAYVRGTLRPFLELVAAASR